MTGLGIAVAIPAVVFYNLAIRINRRVMYHANDRAHDLLAQSRELAAVQQAPIQKTAVQLDTTNQVTQLTKQANADKQAAQYHKSAPSQL